MKLHAFIKNSAKIILLLFGISKRPVGLENLPKDRGFIIACNHVSNLDPVKLGALIPGYLRYLAKAELFQKRWSNWFLSKLGAIPLSRGKADVGAIKAGEEVINNGGMLIIFPQQHRRKVFRIEDGKKGAERLANRTGCPVVPVGIKGRNITIGKAILNNPSTEDIMKAIEELLSA